MAYLLDSHAVLWFLADPTMLSNDVSRLLADETAAIFVSPVSAYELRYKAAQGKMKPLPDSFLALTAASGFIELQLSSGASEIAAGLSLAHRDPWDRMLAGQAIDMGYSLVTKDWRLTKLGVRTFW